MKTDTWQCAGWSDELAAGAVGRRLLGRDLVLFRDASGAAHALGARCPHRGADLAKGSVVDGCVQCPFHGWRFDGDGQCVWVPSQPASMKISRLAHVPSFPLRERHGVLWIWMGGGAPASAEPPPAPDPALGRPARRLLFDPRLIDAPFLDVLENFFDQAHAPFIHRGTFGPDQDPLVARQLVTVDADGQGLRAENDAASPWQARPRELSGVLGFLARLLLGLRTPSAQHMRFAVGGDAHVYLEYPRGTFDLFVTHMTPADERHTWLFVESVRTRAAHAIGDWFQRRAITRLFAEGRRETSLLLGADPDDVPSRVSVESDKVGLAARHLHERWARGSLPAIAGDLAASS